MKISARVFSFGSLLLSSKTIFPSYNFFRSSIVTSFNLHRMISTSDSSTPNGEELKQTSTSLEINLNKRQRTSDEANEQPQKVLKEKLNYHTLVPLPPALHQVLSPEDLPSRNLIIVGDVHGCLVELKELLSRCDYDGSGGRDKVILLGDLVNKGPYSDGVIKYAREKGFYCIRGNHDDFVLCHSIPDTLPAAISRPPALDYIDNLTQEDIDWLKDLPYTIVIPSWNVICVHAGLVPFVPLRNQLRTNMVVMRNLLGDSNPATCRNFEATSRIDEGIPWVEGWNGTCDLTDVTTVDGTTEKPWHVYFGHDARRGLQLTPHATGLDTGCSYGKKLTGIILPERKIVDVNALAEYSPVSDS